jgi:hypothetical protein
MPIQPNVNTKAANSDARGRIRSRVKYAFLVSMTHCPCSDDYCWQQQGETDVPRITPEDRIVGSLARTIWGRLSAKVSARLPKSTPLAPLLHLDQRVAMH